MAKPDDIHIKVDAGNDVAYLDTGKSHKYINAFKQGSSTLIAGAKTVTDSSAKTTSKIFVTDKTAANAIAVVTKSNGSFIVNGTTTHEFDYLIVNL